MSKILLEKMQFYAYHGHFEEEQRVGTKFEITLAVDVNTDKVAQTDCLEDALNYVELYQLVKKEMETTSHLLEHVAKRITDKLFANFPQIEALQLTLSKMNPPLGGQVERVSLEVSEKRIK